MGTEKKSRPVKDFFAAIGRGDKQGTQRCVPKILSGSFRARIGRWLNAPRLPGLADLFKTHSEKVETSFMEPANL